LKLENVSGRIEVMGEAILVPKEQLVENSVLIELDQKAMKPGQTPVRVGVYSNNRKIETLKTIFIGPRDDTHPK
jgi:hypothetical protein